MSKIDIDFLVSSNAYNLSILDISNWGLIENQPSIVEITLPGYKSCVTKYFDKCKNNIYNSITLEINCVDDCGKSEKLTLPDGIYKIKVIGSPSTYNKEYYYLKTDLFNMELDKLIIDIQTKDKRTKKDFMDKLTEIEFLLKSAGSFLRYDEITTSGMMFEQCLLMLEDLKKCKSCK